MLLERLPTPSPTQFRLPRRDYKDLKFCFVANVAIGPDAKRKGPVVGETTGPVAAIEVWVLGGGTAAEEILLFGWSSCWSHPPLDNKTIHHDVPNCRTVFSCFLCERGPNLPRKTRATHRFYPISRRHEPPSRLQGPAAPGRFAAQTGGFPALLIGPGEFR